ncbi:MAG: hypoxanthine phosphoribosyltransferase [Epulopiscium sp. Nele67-Bin002]|nr:MAG: hypoxanthine phosphoribosyltransferase [Epulopiscium sp. Nuni2H_MBin001]OON91903.1 MAG: hypoxanthine phosphoribosyltransferase [Epulopiscium sp. Nele67-Bin002]OON92408.1 MAG: hypoxanthine phosphoribosyltransferase [Epulopiscium sp. Nele67-Bin001]
MNDLQGGHMEILISEQDILAKVTELGQNISRDYDGKEVILICVLKGAVMFTVDLAKHINIPVKLDFMAVSSYGSGKVSSGVVKIIKDLDDSIEGKHVIIVEDIIDSGQTLNYLLSVLWGRKPASMKVCALLDKPDRRQANVNADYIGFTIPDEFIIGYGLDYDQLYRNLPYVAMLKED